MSAEHSAPGIEASVVMPARNAAATIDEQLEALAGQTVREGWEVVVVDNSSTDDTVRRAQAWSDRLPALTVLPCPRPGANAARNVGAGAAAGRYLLFCDADDVVDRAWVETMLRALRTGADAVGGRLDDDALTEGDDRRIVRHPPGMPVAAGFLPRALTANFAVRKDAWEAVGGFNEEYQYGATDTEFCWRLQLASFSLVHEEDAVVAYRHRGTLRDVARKQFKTGRARARLFRDFRSAGMPQPRLLGALARWARLVVTAPLALVSVRHRWRWVGQAAGALGRIDGSVRFGVRYL